MLVSLDYKEVNAMTHTNTIPTDVRELTLLALGKDCGLYGDNTGKVYRVCDRCAGYVTTKAPRRVYIESFDAQDIYGFPFVVSEDIPKDMLLAFDRVRDFDSGLGVYAAFDPRRAEWYIRERVDAKTLRGNGEFIFYGAELLSQ